MRARRRNPWYLSDVDLPEGDRADDRRGAAAVASASLIVIAVPSEFFADALARLGAVSAPVVSATKGFDPVRHRRMSEVVAERWPTAGVAVLSGPTFAREVALGQPTAAVIASPRRRAGRRAAAASRLARVPALHEPRRRRRRGRRGAQERDRGGDRAGRRPRAWARTRAPRWSRAAWPRSRGWPSRSAASRRRWRGWPGSATWC